MAEESGMRQRIVERLLEDPAPEDAWRLVEHVGSVHTALRDVVDTATALMNAKGAGVLPKVVYKAVAGGALAARRRAGAWVLRASDVRAWARRRAR